MKAQELRIGNLIRWEDPSDDIVQITGIHKAKGIAEFGYFVDYKETSRDECGCALLDEFIPIPLTPEWLERLGFVRCSCGGYKHKDVHLDRELVYNKIKVLYLHQLQNLFHSLTGEELTIKELA